jgi:pilus assembly protein Flp/PilA
MFNTLQFVRTVLMGLDAKRKSEAGATAVEYGLMVALIAIGIVTAVVFLEDSLSGLFNQVGSSL